METKVVKFSDIYGTNVINDISEVKLIGQLALCLKRKGIKLDLLDLEFKNGVAFTINFSEVFAININQSNIICRKLRNVPKVSLQYVYPNLKPTYKNMDGVCVLDVSDALRVGMSSDRGLIILRMIGCVLYDYFEETGKSLFKDMRIKIPLNSSYAPEDLGDFLVSMFNDGYLADHITIELHRLPTDKKDIYETYRRYVYYQEMNKRHYGYILKCMKQIMKNRTDDKEDFDASFSLAEKYLLNKKIELLKKLPEGQVLNWVKVANVLNSYINEEATVLVKGYYKGSNSIALQVVPASLNTPAGYQALADSVDSVYSEFLIEEYQNKKPSIRRENLNVNGLAVLDICIDELVMRGFKRIGSKSHRPGNLIKKEYDYMRDENRLYYLDNNRLTELYLFNDIDMYRGGGSYRKYIVRYPVFIYHALKSQDIKFNEEAFIKQYRLNANDISGNIE